MAALEILTDEAIIDYTRKGNKNFILTDGNDFNRKNRRYPKPYPKGIFDPEIFGSCYPDRCYCGKIRTVSTEPCPECDAMVLKREDALRRFARIELPFYYLNPLRFEVFSDLFTEIFSNTEVVKDFSDTPENLGFSVTGSRKFNQKVFDYCQFEYSPESKELRVTDKITDEAKCSYEGLLAIIEANFPSKLVQFKELINHLYLVMPAVMRPPVLIPKPGAKRPEIGLDKLSVWYRTILTLCCAANRDGNSSNYNLVMKRFKTPAERVGYTALLRALLRVGNSEASSLLNTSKENLARGLHSVRVKNSMRSPIIPSVDLPIDQARIPRHLAYEIFRSGFIKYIMEKYNFSEDEATLSTRLEAMNPEMQQEFTDYIEGNESKGLKGQCIILNRAPSLHIV